MSLETFIAEGKASQKSDWSWAWQNFLPVVKALIVEAQCKNILEVGGGRSPSFAEEEMSSMQATYTANDISASELSRAPAWVKTAHFDIQTPNVSDIEQFREKFDFVFSKMVMEHVESYERAYRNIFTVLSPGGISIAFHPVYYAIPFVVNKILPEKLTNEVLKKVFPYRNEGEVPKFPAHYSGCVISEPVRQELYSIGFKRVWQIPFYGHPYYRKIPLFQKANDSFSAMLAKNEVSKWGSYCFTIVEK